MLVRSIVFLSICSVDSAHEEGSDDILATRPKIGISDALAQAGRAMLGSSGLGAYPSAIQNLIANTSRSAIFQTPASRR